MNYLLTTTAVQIHQPKQGIVQSTENVQSQKDSRPMEPHPTNWKRLSQVVLKSYIYLTISIQYLL
jgi:hypothetical protein